jgi:hypothetical protein
MSQAQFSAPRTQRHRVGRSLVLATSVLATLAGLLALLSAVWAILFMRQTGEVWYGEAIIHDQAGRLIRGEPLYQPIEGPPYTVTAYTPLFYGVAAGLQAAFGPGFVPGRVVSFLSGLTCAVLVAVLAHSFSRNPRDSRLRSLFGTLAALLFLGLNNQWERGAPWWAYYKQDTLGIAFALGAVALLAHGTGTRRVVLAGIFAGLAILTKQTLFAASVSGVLWLWFFRRDRSLAATFGGTSLAITLVPCLILEVTTRAFFANTVWSNVNPTLWRVLLANVAAFSSTQLGQLFVCLLHLLRRRHDPERRGDSLLVTYWLCSAVPLVGLTKVGASYNYWLEFAAASAALAAVGISASFTSRSVSGEVQTGRPVLPVGFLGIHLALLLVWGGRAVGEPLIAGRLNFTPDPVIADELTRLVERVRQEPREVLGHSFDIVSLAGRRNLFEPDIYSIFYSQGRWDPSPLVARIQAGEVGLLVLDRSLDDTEYWAPRPIGWWPEPVMTALRERMILDSRLARRWLYVPRSGP